MAGRRALTEKEERRFLRKVRRLPFRNRTLVTTQWFTGFRISEVLSLKVHQVWRDRQVVSRIGVRPENLKGHRGTTRWVPVSPELRRTLQDYIGQREEEEGGPLDPAAPLILSRQVNRDGSQRAITRGSAHVIIKEVMAKARVHDDGRLGTHTLRKTLAKKVYVLSGKDIMVTRDAMGHSSLTVTERYLETSREDVDRAILMGDFTRRPHRRRRSA